MLGPHFPDIRSLELLVEIGRGGSIAAAAARLHVSQQAVSSRLKRLEGLLGTKLVLRRSQDSVLTPDGLLVVQWATTLLDSAALVDAGIASLHRGRPDTLNLASSLTVAEYFLPHWLAALNVSERQHGRPQIPVTMVATNAEQAASLVSNNEADIGFVEGITAPAGLHYQSLATDELYLVVAPRHPWAQSTSRSVTADEVAATPLVMRERGSGCRSVLENALVVAGIDESQITPPLLEMASNVAIVEAVADGAGAAAITMHAARPLIADGRLVRISTPELDLRRHLGAVWKGESTPASKAARMLLAEATK